MVKVNEFRSLYLSVKDQAEKDYLTYLKFPSISADPAYKNEMKQCSDWLANYLNIPPLKVNIWPSKGHPVIFASYDGAGPNQPTLLLYGHYDVQPVTPLEEWKSPPFEPTVINGEVYARGAQDNKGQNFYTALAITTLLKKFGRLPINIKFLIEGEEEMGSIHLKDVLKAHQNEIQADYVAIVDAGMRDKTTPCVSLGARGITTMDVEFIGTNQDLHSGTHGGVAYNPLHALVECLAKLRDPKTGKVTIPGFYDDVVELTPEEKQACSFDFDEAAYIKTFGQKPTGGEKGYSPAERGGVRPTIEINGISGGYGGAGFKTVIPAKATAKVSCRLVPNQTPAATAKLVADFLIQQAPPGIEVQVHQHAGGGVAVRANPFSPIAQAFAKAYEEVFNRPCLYIYEGGSIPITHDLANLSGGEPVFVGLGLSDDQIHAPNEHFSLERIEKGFLSICRTLELLSRKGDPS